ncbi:MAG TPA: class I SAM-dependent methyltransferase [Caulobacteraceae bacterium]|nr:class I SAM-dependent methyltransferase [Caulobacteraceae bacterium]
MLDAVAYPNSARLVAALLDVWPEHERFLCQSFGGRDSTQLAATERLAAKVLEIVPKDALRAHCGDYRFMSELFLEEELHFRRTGAYRLSTFADAYAEVYSNTELMPRYVNFILLTHVMWENHARALFDLEQRYLPALPPGTRHLEVGPGHGLLLHLAGDSPTVSEITGWDVSETSIEHTRDCLAAMGNTCPLTLVRQDLFDATPTAPEDRFGSAVISEVLEHLEDPVGALAALSRHLASGAHLWVNVPVNSPAPDHIYLLRTPEEAVSMVEKAGFEPTRSEFIPMTGQTLERARKRDLTISAVISARLLG